MVAEALGVPLRELFTSIDSDDLNGRIDSLEARTQEDQVQRNRTRRAWMWLFVGVGVIVSFLSFTAGGQYGAVLFFGFWGGGLLLLLALRKLPLDSHLDKRSPLSHSREQLRKQKR